MADTVDLNADMGESYGPWVMGNDAALLNVVSSANIACGFHAGDPDVMARTVDMALRNGVSVGAHPGFDDIRNFGRRRLPIDAPSLANSIRYQFGAIEGVTRAAGGRVGHFKLHGALSNMACEDGDLARLCYEAALSVNPDVVIFVLAATAMEKVAKDLGCAYANEIFADRAYNDDATLVDRKLPGAMIHDPDQAASRMVEMVKAGAIITESGKHIPTRIDTICVHGDNETALAIARGVHSSLEAAGVRVTNDWA